MRFFLQQQFFGWAIGLAFFAPSLAVNAESVDYNRDIRPVLSRNCFSCHGPDEESRKAGLRLDVREGALAERNGLPAIVPGKRGESELYARLVTTGQDDIMPPADSGHELTAEEIESIGKWIDRGAPYARHWAFVPPVRPGVPPVEDREWVKNAIDYFILSGSRRRGISPTNWRSLHDYPSAVARPDRAAAHTRRCGGVR